MTFAELESLCGSRLRNGVRVVSVRPAPVGRNEPVATIWSPRVQQHVVVSASVVDGWLRMYGLKTTEAST